MIAGFSLIFCPLSDCERLRVAESDISALGHVQTFGGGWKAIANPGKSKTDSAFAVSLAYSFLRYFL